MEITHYLYNSFVVAADGLRVAIDPGGELYHFRFRPIIPREVWSSITHVLVTHADPDHHWHTDRLVAESDATVICGTGLTAEHGPLSFPLGPIRKTLHPGPKERIGYGATGFLLEIEDRVIVNLGDTLKLLDQWTGIPRPDVLMIPIGGEKLATPWAIEMLSK